MTMSRDAGRNAHDLPIVDGDRISGGSYDESSVGRVLLAASTSSQFGKRNKLLVMIDGDMGVRRSADVFVKSSVPFEPLMVVLGYEAV